jgi:hypothetical protein
VPCADQKAPNQGVRSNCTSHVSFKLVRTPISIGWLFLFNAGILKKSLLFSAVVFLPLYIDTNPNDVGGDAHLM